MRTIDLFAGAGGFTTGAEQAGANVLWAGNHWPLAIEVHTANHPHIKHLCQDLHQANWDQVPDHDLLLASPSCQGHSNARGKEQVRHDAARATAWAVVSACEVKRPQTALVENVKEFIDWTLFPAWKMALEALGYNITIGVYDAADFGVPQHRVRAFICANLGKRIYLEAPNITHRPARDFISFSSGSWSDIQKRGRSLKTLESIANGRAKFGKTFLTPYYSSGSGLTGRSLDRPIGTITTKARWALIDGDRMRMLTIKEQKKAMGFSEDYWLPKAGYKALHLLGNAVPPPMVKHFVEQLI